MPWYENPIISAILGGLAGAVVTAAVSIFIWRRTYKIKRIDCVINDVSSLLTFSDKIRDQLEVKFAGRQASSVYLFALEVTNTGTEAILKQPVNIRLSDGAKIVDYTINTEPDVGFGEIEEKQKDGYALDLQIALLNPGDRVLLEILSLDNLNQDINVYMKNANVLPRVYSRTSAERELTSALNDKQMLLLAAFGTLPLVGGFAKSLMTIALAQRIDRIAKK